jgi:hypothetical protein
MSLPFNTFKNTITNIDLYSNKFPIDILEKNIDKLDLTTLIKTQDLTYEFIVTYVLNEEYQITPEEKTIDIYDVVYNQKNIDIDVLKNMLNNHK